MEWIQFSLNLGNLFTDSIKENVFYAELVVIRMQFHKEGSLNPGNALNNGVKYIFFNTESAIH